MKYKIVPCEPTKYMLKNAARAMSPGYRKTPEWVSNTEKHKTRYQAMIEVAPNTGLIGVLNSILNFLFR